MAIAVQTLAQEAYNLIGVYAPGEQLSPADAQDGRAAINRMVGQWRQKALMAIVTSRERFDLEADRGGIDDPYTIGPGGDFDTSKPPNQQSLVAANLVLTSPGPPNEVRVPLGLYTDLADFANQIPDMRSGQPTGLYYSPTYAGGLGTITLWPVPSVDTNDLELLIQQPLGYFATLTTAYDLPDGWDEAIIYNAALRLAAPNGAEIPTEVRQIAKNALRTIQAANTVLTDVANDAYLFTQGRRTLYNIDSGSGG